MANAKEILKRWEKLKSKRSVWDEHWQVVKELVRPNASDFNRQTVQGERRTERIFDGTAMWALNQLAGGLHSYLTSPTSRWFSASLLERDTKRGKRMMERDSVRQWLQDISNGIYSHYRSPDVAFNPMLHEGYLDIGAFGTCCVYQDRSVRTMRPFFRSFSLADCWFMENADGRIDTVQRRVVWSARQVIQRFGQDTPEKIKEAYQKDSDKEFTFIHEVTPRSDYNKKSSNSKNMPFASCWVNVEFKELVAESGYEENPYSIPRWSKTSGEVYGRSPGMDCLPDIQMVNQLKRTILRGAQKQVDPPIIVQDDGVLLPLNTFPSATIYKSPGAEDPKPLLTGGRIDIGDQQLEDTRNHIMRCFFVDLMRANRKKERQSVLEIQDDRDEQHRMMGPIISRLETELLGPMIRRTYRLLDQVGMIPPAPPELIESGMKLDIEYTSPASRAQMFSDTVSIQQLLQDLSIIAPFQPQVYDIVDTDEAARLLALNRDVPISVIRNTQKVLEIRQQRQEQEQMSQMAATGGQAASGLKDYAQAQLALKQASNE